MWGSGWSGSEGEGGGYGHTCQGPGDEPVGIPPSAQVCLGTHLSAVGALRSGPLLVLPHLGQRPWVGVEEAVRTPQVLPWGACPCLSCTPGASTSRAVDVQSGWGSPSPHPFPNSLPETFPGLGKSGAEAMQDVNLVPTSASCLAGWSLDVPVPPVDAAP